MEKICEYIFLKLVIDNLKSTGNELEFSRGILEATLGRGVASHQLLIAEFWLRRAVAERVSSEVGNENHSQQLTSC